MFPVRPEIRQRRPFHKTCVHPWRPPIFTPLMSRMQLPATNKTPSVLFDTDQGLLELVGSSIHENADHFYRPLLEQLEDYIRSPAKHTVVRITLEYFNSSSAKYILELLKVLDEVHAAGTATVLLEWHHAKDDLDMAEAGEDYRSLLEMPVKLIAD